MASRYPWHPFPTRSLDTAIGSGHGEQAYDRHVTGAGGQIGYALLFRIAAGEMLGPDRPIRLRLLEIPQGVRAAEGAALELQDCAFPLLHDVEVTDDPRVAFEGCSIALLVGARPRGPGMERADLLAANAGIFGPQGAAIAAAAADDVRVAVVGNPANTNALIAAASARGTCRRTGSRRSPGSTTTARSASSTEALDARPDEIAGVAIWGNHSATQFPDVEHATVRGVPVTDALAQRHGGRDAATRVARRGLRPARRAARCRDHRGPGIVVGGIRRQCRDRARPRRSARDGRGLDVCGGGLAR